MFCRYFQAHVIPKECWFVIAILKAEEHTAFVRTFDVKESILEFFVPESMVSQFHVITQKFVQKGCMSLPKELPNRLMDAL